MLRHIAIDGIDAGRKIPSVGVHVEEALHHQVLKLHAVEMSGHVPPDGVGLETVVPGEVDPVQGSATLGLGNAVIKVFHGRHEFRGVCLVSCGLLLYLFFFFLRRQSLLKSGDRLFHLFQFLPQLSIVVGSGRGWLV